MYNYDSYTLKKYYHFTLLTNDDGLWLQVMDSNDAVPKSPNKTKLRRLYHFCNTISDCHYMKKKKIIIFCTYPKPTRLLTKLSDNIVATQSTESIDFQFCLPDDVSSEYSDYTI